jgi:hypothetical protein
LGSIATAIKNGIGAAIKSQTEDVKADRGLRLGICVIALASNEKEISHGKVAAIALCIENMVVAQDPKASWLR